MSAFDEFQRRMEMEERLRRTLIVDDTARRALQESNAGRHLRELAEQQASAATRARELFERSNLGQVAQQLQRTFGEGGAFQTATERLRQIDTFRNVDRFTNLQFADQTIRDRISASLDAYNRNFIVPPNGAIAQLAEKMAALEPLRDSVAKAIKAMESMRTPWLDQTRLLESAGAFSNLQMIGAGVHSRPFDTDFTLSLRSRFGDWRDVATFPPAILDDPVARTDFYVEHGFDSSLVEFPEEAFEEATDLAGLLDEVGEAEGVDFSLFDRCYRHVARVEYKLRRYIHSVMTAQFGPDWYKRMPKDVIDRWADTKQRRLKEGQSEQPMLLGYSELSDLIQIIERKDHFEFFKPLFRSKESAQESFRRLVPVRHAVMHVGVVTQLDVLTATAETLRILTAIQKAEDA